MSLETVIAENTSALRELIAAIKVGASTTPAQVAAVVKEASTKKAPSSAQTQTASDSSANSSTGSTKGSASGKGADAGNVQQDADAKTDASTAQSAAPGDAPTYQQTADAVTKLARTKGRDAAISVLKKFSAAKLPDVKPEQYGAVLAACEEAMEA